MNHSVSFIVITVLLTLIVAGRSLAQPASNATYCTMAYNGILVDNSDRPVSDTIHSVTIRLYNEPEGSTAPIWQDEFSIATRGGVFSVILGSQRPFPNPTGLRLWIGVSMGSNEPEILPFSASMLLTNIAVSSKPSSNAIKSIHNATEQSTNINLNLDTTFIIPTSISHPIPPR